MVGFVYLDMNTQYMIDVVSDDSDENDVFCHGKATTWIAVCQDVPRTDWYSILLAEDKCNTTVCTPGDTP